jgi:hypothetical protein
MQSHGKMTKYGLLSKINDHTEYQYDLSQVGLLLIIQDMIICC